MRSKKTDAAAAPRRSVGGLLLLLLAPLLLLVLPVPAAHAADEESVRQLDVSFDVRPDGTVGVRYVLDWNFAEKGRHGIDFGIVTSEVWENDRDQQATYSVENLQVTSPTGAPTEFTESERSSHDQKSRKLRIGSPDVEVDEQETYVVTYDLTGALRTFDGQPEFHWDVTGSDYPTIDSFRVTVAAPQPIPRARCLAGSKQCAAEVVDGRAVLSGKDLRSGRPLTAVAALPAGSVANAEPRLGPREYESAILQSRQSTVTIGPDAVARVQSRMRFGVPEDGGSIMIEQPIRRNVTRTEDRAYQVSTPVVRTSDGEPLEVTPSRIRELTEDDDQDFDVDLPEGRRQIEIVAEWEVRGAIATEGAQARFHWPLAGARSMGSEETTQSFRWELPADASRADHRKIDGSTCRGPGVPLDVAGRQVTLGWQNEANYLPSNCWVSIEFPAASVGNPQAMIEPGIEHTRNVATAKTVGGSVLGGGLLGLVGLLVGRVRTGTRDQRFADVAPGIISDGPVTEARRSGKVPVRFEPPECSVAQAGFLTDGAYRSRHTAATLVSMATGNLVTIRSKPLTVAQVDHVQPKDPTERSLWGLANDSGDTTALSDDKIRAMNKRVEKDFKAFSLRPELFRQGASDTTGNRIRLALMAVLPLLAAISLFADWPLTVTIVLAVAAIGFAVGMTVGRSRRRQRALGPRGTALVEQTEGFRTYLHTAEADQLDFEADRDIFREFLPWAVLFGETKRWTKICQQLADANRIEQPDISFWMGANSLGDLGSGLSSFSSTVVSTGTSASSSGGSGGSGGSSGFSGGSSGGGGGGGTSASSW